MSQKLYLLLSFIIFCSSNLTSLGSLIGAGLTNFDPITKTSTVVLLQALASLLVIGVNRVTFLQQTPSRHRLLTALLSVFAVDFVLLVLPPFQTLWYLSLFVRTIASYWASALILADLSLLYVENISEINRRSQTLSVISLAVALGLSPILADGGHFLPLFSSDSLVAFLALFLTALYYPKKKWKDGADGKNERNVNDPSGMSKVSLWGNIEYRVILGITGLTWSIIGAFHVVEVPLLKSRFDASIMEISALFLLTLVANVLTLQLLPKTLEERHLFKIFGLAAIVLVGLSVLYLHSHYFTLSVIALVAFGAANAAFNITQSFWVQRISSAKHRLEILMLIRIITNLGILVATLVVFFGQHFHDQFRSLTVLGLFSIVGILSLGAARRRITTKGDSSRLFGSISIMLAIPFSIASSYPNSCAAKNALILRHPITALPSSLDPVKVLHINAALVTGQLYDTLYEYDENNLLRPNLVKSHTINPTSTIFRLRLRGDVKFSDSSTLTASDVVSSLKRAIGELGLSARWALGDLVGFEEITKNGASIQVSGLQVNKDGEVVISLLRPFPQLLQVLAAPYFAIVKEQNGKLLGTGDYIPEELNEKRIVLVRHEQKPNTGPDRVEFYKVGSRAEGARGVVSGIFDIALVDDEFGGRLLVDNSRANFRRESFKLLQTTLIQLNTRSPVFRDAKIRCDFIERFAGAAKETHLSWRPVAEGLPFFWEMFAEQSIETSKKQRGRFPGPIEVLFAESASGMSSTTIQRLSARLRDFWGVEVKFRKQSAPDLFANMKSGKFDAAFWGYIPDYPDPASLLIPLLGTNQQYNFSGYADETIDSLLDLIRQVDHAQSRGLIFKKVFARVNQECPVGFLGAENGAYVINRNWHLPPVGSLGFHMMKIKRMVYSK